jgi:hypothetical protein
MLQNDTGNQSTLLEARDGSHTPFTFRGHPRLYTACAHASVMSGADSSVRVSRETLRDLEQIRVAFNVRTAEDAIRKLIRERRSRALDRLIGSGKGKLRRFTEADRLESHH